MSLIGVSNHLLFFHIIVYKLNNIDYNRALVKKEASMTTKAYLITAYERKIFLCGLDENDLSMRPMLKSEYEKANVIYISSNGTDFANRYFASTTCKASAVKQTIHTMTTLSDAIKRSRWSALCLVNVDELEELCQKLSSLGTVTTVDFNQFDPNFDDDDHYYDRFPHVLTTNAASYVGILSVLTEEPPEPTDQPSLACLSTNDRMDIEVTNATPFNDSTPGHFMEVYQTDELQLVPYVEPVDENLEEDEDEDEDELAMNCIIM